MSKKTGERFTDDEIKVLVGLVLEHLERNPKAASDARWEALWQKLVTLAAENDRLAVPA